MFHLPTNKHTNNDRSLVGRGRCKNGAIFWKFNDSQGSGCKELSLEYGISIRTPDTTLKVGGCWGDTQKILCFWAVLKGRTFCQTWLTDRSKPPKHPKVKTLSTSHDWFAWPCKSVCVIYGRQVSAKNKFPILAQILQTIFAFSQLAFFLFLAPVKKFFLFVVQ